MAKVVCFLVMSDFDFCCLCRLTWRINQGHVVTDIQSSFLHQSDGHSLCSLVQLYARRRARYSALRRTEATSEKFFQFQTVLHKEHAADATFHCPYFNNTASAFKDSVSVFWKPCCWYHELLECWSILYILFWASDSEAASKWIW